jgi:hypothetical protein
MPTDVLTLREEQAHTHGAVHEAVCQRHRELAAHSPENADLMYLALRCETPGPERDRRLIAARVKAPNSAWLALIASDAYERSNDLDGALAALTLATNIPVMKPYVAVDAARVLRLTGHTSEAAQLATSSPLLRARLVAEGDEQRFDGEPLSPILMAYQHLAHGRLQAALQVAPEAHRTRVARLVGASRGASPAQVDAALALDDEPELDEFALVASIGLRLRHQRDAKPFVTRLSASLNPKELEALQEFMQADKLLGKPDTLAQQCTLVRRGQLYVLGAVILGERTPEAWLTTLRAVLLPDERPHL